MAHPYIFHVIMSFENKARCAILRVIWNSGYTEAHSGLVRSSFVGTQSDLLLSKRIDIKEISSVLLKPSSHHISTQDPIGHGTVPARGNNSLTDVCHIQNFIGNTMGT